MRTIAMMLALLALVCAPAAARAQSAQPASAEAVRAGNAIMDAVTPATVTHLRTSFSGFSASVMGSPEVTSLDPEARARAQVAISHFPDLVGQAYLQQVPAVDEGGVPPRVVAMLDRHLAQSPQDGQPAPAPQAVLADFFQTTFSTRDRAPIADFLETPSGHVFIEQVFRASIYNERLSISDLPAADRAVVDRFTATQPGRAFTAQLGQIMFTTQRAMQASLRSQYRPMMLAFANDICVAIGTDPCITFAESGLLTGR